MTTTDLTALHAAVVAKPDEDGPRLAYADCLDEQETRYVKCLACAGNGGAWDDGGFKYQTPFWSDCPICSGSGEVADTSARDRAEFIRLSVEAEQFAALRDGDLSQSKVYTEYAVRINRLLAAHPEWLRLECPACGVRQLDRECPTCGNSCDLFDEVADGPHPSRNPVFRRGFVEIVECRLAEVGTDRCDVCGGSGNGTTWTPGVGPSKDCRKCGGTGNWFVPSPWARAVVAAVPLAAFRVTDREPDQSRTHDLAGWMRRETLAECEISLNAIPGVLFDELSGYESVPCPPEFGKWYRTRDAAHAALGAALVRLVRG